jgi:hypothetical protein
MHEDVSGDDAVSDQFHFGLLLPEQRTIHEDTKPDHLFVRFRVISWIVLVVTDRRDEQS